MKARFKPRKSKLSYLTKFIIFIFIIILSFVLTFKFLYSKLNIDLDDDKYISYLVQDSFSNLNIVDLASLSSTKFLLKYSFGITSFDTGIGNVSATLKESDILNNEELEKEDTTNVDATEPTVYIFNTHQTEGYKSDIKEAFNIDNTVFIASHILKEYLNDLGINVIVEEESISDILNTFGWKYGSSYKASRILLEDAYKNNSSLNFFIDLHRDSSSYERTTTEIDGKKYAKIMFVVGLEHDNYQPNLELAEKLSTMVKSYNSALSRGVLQKQGKGVNGIYNQDFNPNTILIEVGGQYNTIEEVNNTLRIFANILFSYLLGEK